MSEHKVVRLGNDEALDVVEVGVSGGDLIDAKTARDGEIDRVDSEQPELPLEFERDSEVRFLGLS